MQTARLVEPCFSVARAASSRPNRPAASSLAVKWRVVKSYTIPLEAWGKRRSGRIKAETSEDSQNVIELKVGSGDVPDFELVSIPGNGSCMFQAIAQCSNYLSEGLLLFPTELPGKGFELRRQVCLMLDKYRADVEPFIAGDFDAYLHHMSTEGTWGGEPELAMATKVVSRPILVYRTAKSSLFSKELSKASQYGVDDYPNLPPICLLFGNYHYDALLAKQ